MSIIKGLVKNKHETLPFLIMLLDVGISVYGFWSVGTEHYEQKYKIMICINAIANLMMNSFMFYCYYVYLRNKYILNMENNKLMGACLQVPMIGSTILGFIWLFGFSGSRTLVTTIYIARNFVPILSLLTVVTIIAVFESLYNICKWFKILYKVHKVNQYTFMDGELTPDNKMVIKFKNHKKIRRVSYGLTMYALCNVILTLILLIGIVTKDNKAKINIGEFGGEVWKSCIWFVTCVFSMDALYKFYKERKQISPTFACTYFLSAMSQFFTAGNLSGDNIGVIKEKHQFIYASMIYQFMNFMLLISVVGLFILLAAFGICIRKYRNRNRNRDIEMNEAPPAVAVIEQP